MYGLFSPFHLFMAALLAMVLRFTESKAVSGGFTGLFLHRHEPEAAEIHRVPAFGDGIDGERHVARAGDFQGAGEVRAAEFDAVFRRWRGALKFLAADSDFKISRGFRGNIRDDGELSPTIHLETPRGGVVGVRPIADVVLAAADFVLEAAMQSGLARKQANRTVRFLDDGRGGDFRRAFDF